MQTSWIAATLWVLAQAAVAQGVPADSAENARVAPPAAAPLRPGPDGQIDPGALVAAVRLDALREAGPGGRVAEVLAPQPVVWNDGALGCPRPGLTYTQALVPGWRVVVRLSDGRRLDYHASRSGDWLRCTQPQPGPAVPAASR